MKNKLFLALSFIVIATWTTSCYKDKLDFSKLSTNINWNPNLAVPAVHSNLTIRDLLRDYDSTELFVEDATGFLYLMYHKQVFSLPASDYVSLPDQTFSDNFTGTNFIAQGFPASSPATVTKNYTHIMVLQLMSDSFDSLVFKNGTFTLDVSSTFLHTGLLTITFPTVKDNLGLPYSKTVNISTSTGTFTYNQSFYDLAGYTADFTNPGFNQLPVSLSLTLVKAGSNPVLASDQVSVNMSLNTLQYKIIYGDIGQRNIPIQEDTVNIELFNNTMQGNIYFMDPKFRLYIRNSFGVPFNATFSDFTIYSSVSNSYVTYTFPVAYNPLLITAPLNVSDQPATTMIQLDTTNFLPIRTIVAENPRYVHVTTNAQSNPTGTSQYNFIQDTSRLAVDLEVELPLWGRASYWVMQDTLDFNFSDFYQDSTSTINLNDPDLSNVDWVKFHLNILNGMPTEAGVQIYLTGDSTTNYNIIDSIFTPQNMEIIASGILGGTGKVIAPTRKISDVMFYGSRLANLHNVKKALVRGYIHTTNIGSTIVRFYSDYAIDVKMGVQVQAKLNTSTDF